MTRKMMLIAGVAGLALTSPAGADRGGNKPDRGERQEQSQGQSPKAERQQQQRAERQQERAERPQMQRVERQEMRRAERPQMQRVERQEMRRAERPERIERQEMRRAERAQRIERPQRVERQESRRAERRIERQQQRVERGQESRELRRAERRIERQQQRVERQDMRRAERQFERIDRREDRREARIDKRQDNRAVRIDRRQDVREARDDRRAFREQFVQRFDGPIARQFVSRDMRPMRAFDNDDRRIVSVGERFNLAAQTTFVPTFYRTEYYDTPQYYYRYDDDLGYLYRVNRDNNFVSALIPLFGGYGIGDPWPVTYRSSYVPYGYQSLYYDTPDYYYRSDGYGIYRIDAGTQLISALVALLTGGQGYGIGQMLPSTYGAYNVPLAYRSSYYDTDDSWYRYGDGFIYEVDPNSYRVENRYPLYAGYDDYLVGQPWPVAYPDYNVPYGYQSLYYDTPQSNYRYANGAIYQVDPTTQLITAIVSLLSGQNFSVGQALPAGFSTYNVPFAYRDRYADTADDWYRYNNGFVYQVDPDTGLIEEAYPVYT